MEEVRRIGKRGQVVCVVTFDGVEYRRYPNGKHRNYYYHRKVEDGKLYVTILHHAIYEKAHGAIPKGMCIHHKDFNPLNNDLDNLMLVTLSEHMRIHKSFSKWNKEHPDEMRKRRYTKENWHERRKKVLANLENERRKCEWCGSEYTPTNTHQRFCSKRCHHRWQYVAPQNNVPMVCQNCGKTFLGNKYLRPKCCCDKCAHELSTNKRTGSRTV